jgi:hypothetical protein
MHSHCAESPKAGPLESRALGSGGTQNRSPKRESSARKSLDEVRKPRKAGASIEEMPAPAGEKLRGADASLARAGRKSAWESCPGSRVQPAGVESLEGQDVKRATAAPGFRSLAVRIPWGEEGSEAGFRGWRLAATPAGLTRRRARASREVPIPGEEEGPEDGTSRAFRVAVRRSGRRGGEQAVEGVEGARESAHLHKRRGRKVARLDASRGCGRAAVTSRSCNRSRIRRAGSAVEGQSPGGESFERVPHGARSRHRFTGRPEGGRETGVATGPLRERSGDRSDSKRGGLQGDGPGSWVCEGRPDGRRNGSPGAPNQYRHYFPHPRPLNVRATPRGRARHPRGCEGGRKAPQDPRGSARAAGGEVIQSPVGPQRSSGLT